MRFFSETIRLLLTLSVISSVVLYDYDFRFPIIILSISYFFQFLILYPVLKKSIFRYIVYLIDFAFLFYVVKITDNVYLSLFPLFLLFELKGKVDIYILSILASTMVGYGFYKSGLYDLTLIYLAIVIIIAVINFNFEKDSLKKSLSNMADIAKNIYRDNLICSDKMDFYMRYFNINSSVKKISEDKIKVEDFKKVLFQNLNCDAVIIFDKHKDELHIEGTLDISNIQEIENYIKNLDIDGIKKALNVKYSLVKEIKGYTIVLIYKNYILIDKGLIESID